MNIFTPSKQFSVDIKYRKMNTLQNIELLNKEEQKLTESMEAILHANDAKYFEQLTDKEAISEYEENAKLRRQFREYLNRIESAIDSAMQFYNQELK